MTEHNNPGPPERCYDDCPMNHTGNTEDCTCAGTMLDSDAALFARQRDDAQAIVLSVSRILGISHLADGLERGRVTSAVRSWMDTAAQVTRERDAAGARVGRLRAEIERLTKRADANGRNARFWADHFDEIEKANRDALGAHHKPGHSVAELIAALVGERDEAREHLDKVRQALRTPEGWATKMHALRVRQQRDKARDLLGAIWLHVGWRSVTRHLTTEQRELWADAVEVAGAPGSTIAADRWWRDDAPVSGSDTTTDGA